MPVIKSSYIYNGFKIYALYKNTFTLSTTTCVHTSTHNICMYTPVPKVSASCKQKNLKDSNYLVQQLVYI